MPEDTELFSADPADRADAATDGGAGSLDASREGGALADASSDTDAQGMSEDGGDLDAAGPGDGGGGTEDASQEAGVNPFEPGAGLVVHYRFNESSGSAVHDFAGDNDALIVGAPAGHEQWVSAGRVDGALRLAGGFAPDGGVGHHVELPQGVFLGLNESSIALWVNRASGPMWQRVFDFGSGPPVWLYFTASGGTGLPVVAGRTPALIFVDFVTIPDAPAGAGQLKINQTIPVSTWVHFVLTWSATEIKVYLDGVLAAQAVPHGAVTPTDLGNTGQNYLGRSQFEADSYFDGMIDEFRIYNRVLSASDVAALYQLR